MTITAAIISRNSEIDASLLERLSFADEIIVVSDQPTGEIKSEKKVKYFFRPLENNFSKQRNYALSKAKGEWVLFVDTDEVVSTHLAKEILQAIKSKKYSGYLLTRIDTVFHQLQLHGETGNTKILRLAKRKLGKFSRSVHEQWKIAGRVGELQNPLFHTKDKFISEFLDRIALYGPIDAINLNKENKPFNFFRLLAYPKAKFLLNYFIRLGLLDGLPGLFHAYLMAIQSLSVRVFQWTLNKQSTG